MKMGGGGEPRGFSSLRKFEKKTNAFQEPAGPWASTEEGTGVTPLDALGTVPVCTLPPQPGSQELRRGIYTFIYVPAHKCPCKWNAEATSHHLDVTSSGAGERWDLASHGAPVATLESSGVSPGDRLPGSSSESLGLSLWGPGGETQCTCCTASLESVPAFLLLSPSCPAQLLGELGAHTASTGVSSAHFSWAQLCFH